MLRKAISSHIVLISALTTTLWFSVARAQGPALVPYVEMAQATVVDGSVKKAPGIVAANGIFQTRIGGPVSGGGDIPPVVNAPFSAVLKREEVTKLLDGNRIVRTTSSKLFRDSQGRTRTEHVFPGFANANIDGPSIAQIFDPISGEMTSLNMPQRTAMVFPTANAETAVQAPVSAPPIRPDALLPTLGMGFSVVGFGGNTSVKETSLGEKMINGIRAVGTRGEYSIPANAMNNERPIAITVEQWFSPDLGLILLRTQRSPTGIETTQSLEQVQREEPDRALFLIPADFTKQDMSERLQRLPGLRAEPLPPAK